MITGMNADVPDFVNSKPTADSHNPAQQLHTHKGGTPTPNGKNHRIFIAWGFFLLHGCEGSDPHALRESLGAQQRVFRKRE